MASGELTSPVGQYQPELLVLAPVGGEEANTRSLVSQLLESGVAIELDEDWHLPTAPPRDRSAYNGCLFPESARERDDGRFVHWTDGRGTIGAAWSRGHMWALLTVTKALEALDPASASAAYGREQVVAADRGLRRYLDPDLGLPHLAIDEPETRLEASGTAGSIFCHDRLKKLSVAAAEDDALFDRAFVGMKRLYYRSGVASNCRGTATGLDTYDRTRPMGYCDCSLDAATLVPRAGLATAAGRG